MPDYFHHNATTAFDSRVLESMSPQLTELHIPARRFS
jgi:cysteine sulfinate desulfinase/cysteine desulfurase-like protein